MRNEESATGTASEAVDGQALEQAMRDAEAAMGEAEVAIRAANFFARSPGRFKEAHRLVLLDCVLSLRRARDASEGAAKERAEARLERCEALLEALEGL